MYPRSTNVVFLAVLASSLVLFGLVRAQESEEGSGDQQDDEELKTRSLNETIPETNVKFWEPLPQTGGIRYQNCSAPVEDTRVFMDCKLEGGSENAHRAVCDCKQIASQLHITCYKDGYWYPSVLNTCEPSINETISTEMPDSGNGTLLAIGGSSASRFQHYYYIAIALAIFSTLASFII